MWLIHKPCVLNDNSLQDWPIRKPAHDAGLIFIVYLALALAVDSVPRQPVAIASIWLANGAALAIIASSPRNRVLMLLAIAAMANLVANLVYGHSVGFSLSLVVPNLAEIALGAYLMSHIRRLDLFSTDIALYLSVITAGSLTPPLLGATLGAIALHAFGVTDFASAWDVWYLACAVGGAVVLPIALTLRAYSVSQWREYLFHRELALVIPATFFIAMMALRYLHYPLAALGLLLIVLAFLLRRMSTFIGSFLMACVVTLAPPLDWFVPSELMLLLGHTVLFFATLLMVLVAQSVAVVVAQKRALFKALGRRIDDVVIFLNRDGIIRWANRAREIYWGVSNDQIMGHSYTERVPEPALSEMKAVVEKARTGAIAQRVVDIDFPARGRRTVNIVAQPVYDEEGKQVGVLSCGRDVTELEESRRKLQKVADQLQASNRNLDQFVRIASHDLREPLNTIMQFCDLIDLRQGIQLDDTSKLYFSHVRTGARRMKSMLDDVLQFVRLNGEPAVAMELVSLDDTLAEVRSALQERIEATNAVIEANTLGSVVGYRGHLSLVLQNLISNAIKFVPPGRSPEVRIWILRTDDSFRLTVADNGIGIEVSKIGQLGTPFQRLHSRRKFEGTGLGLAICKSIVEQHGGRLEIESVSGEGSKFHLVFPKQ